MNEYTLKWNPCELETFFSSSQTFDFTLKSFCCSCIQPQCVCVWSYHPFGSRDGCVCGCFFDSKISEYKFCTLTGCCCCCLRLLLVCFCRHRRVSENFYENLRIRNFRTFVRFVFRLLMISDVCCMLLEYAYPAYICVCAAWYLLYGVCLIVWFCVLLYVASVLFDCIVQ